MGNRKPHIPHVESLELKTLMSTGACDGSLGRGRGIGAWHCGASAFVP